MIPFEDQALGTNESLKGFEKTDDLGKSYLDLHGKVAAGSVELLPEDLRKDPTIANYKTVGDVAKALIETKKLVGTIKRPPADAAGYKFTALENMHASVKPDAGFQKALSENAIKLGLTEEQGDGVHKLAMGYVNQLVLNQEKTREENYKKNMGALQQEWGADFDKNLNGVIRMLSKAGGDEVAKELGATLQKAPLALKALSRISGLLSEDSIESLGGQAGGDGSTESDEKEFQAFSTAIASNDQTHPISNEKHPQHMAAVQKWKMLNEKHWSK